MAERMTRDEALTRLRQLAKGRARGDAEEWHSEADEILVALLDDPEVAEAYNAVPKWYA